MHVPLLTDPCGSGNVSIWSMCAFETCPTFAETISTSRLATVPGVTPAVAAATHTPAGVIDLSASLGGANGMWFNPGVVAYHGEDEGHRGKDGGGVVR